MQLLWFLLSHLLPSEIDVMMRAQRRRGLESVGLSSPLLAVEETKGSKNDKQHEPHRGDGEKDVQPPSESSS